MEPPKTHPTEEQWLILDTNIISFLTDKSRQAPVANLLVELQVKGFKPSVSEFTLFEALTNANPNHGVQVERAISELTRFPVNTVVLMFGALLQSCYKAEGAISDPNKGNEGDRIIAATTILQGAQLLTGNAKDFPWPLFTETQTINAEYKSNSGNKQLFPLAILRPNLPILKSHFNKHVEGLTKARATKKDAN